MSSGYSDQGRAGRQKRYEAALSSTHKLAEYARSNRRFNRASGGQSSQVTQSPLPQAPAGDAPEDPGVK